ncbi:TPA: hypothetical protein VGT17_005231 [Vibrio harveyi]|nr:hypothetical protein [Vibrio harveyi]HEQ3599229.1 hypothetical protein [Vibrio harveyi]HEQ3611321.1 hypothetical protein [Vibrio harveyi]
MITISLMMAISSHEPIDIETEKNPNHVLVAPCMNPDSLKFLGWMNKEECKEISGVFPDEIGKKPQ